MALDLTYLKKRAEMTRDFEDEKVAAALSKIIPPAPDFSEGEGFKGFDCEVCGKSIRNWIDLIPGEDRGFVRFVYKDGPETSPEKYLKIAMSKPALKTFRSLVLKDAEEQDLFLMRWLIWHSAVLKEAVGFDFGNYEMNAIFNSLPIDISKKKIKFERPLSFVEFYRMIRFAEWGLANVD